MKPTYLLAVSTALAFFAGSFSAHAAEPPQFERDVRPILKAFCLDCHGGNEKVSAKLDLRLKRFMLQGGESGEAIVPGKPAESLLIERMKSGEMPPGEKKVPASQIAILEQWIAAGAPTLRPEPEKLPPGLDITPEERAYWFYQPLSRPAVPQVKQSQRVRTPIDAFIQAKLEAQSLSMNDDADKRTLIRRATLDLTGLPPTEAEVAAFLADTSEQAYDRLLDRLLASPAYGERWARHWLDVVGYADSEGDATNDTPRDEAWRYRDYVIRAMNADKPIAQFIIEQMAGDELIPRPWNNLTPSQVELLAATNFLRMVPDTTASRNGPAESQQTVADAVKVVGSTLLGLSVGCAQCHDHRYDPIPQSDYFRFRALLEPALNPANWRVPSQRRVSLFTDADRAKAAAVDAEVNKMTAEYSAKEAKAVRAAFEKVLATFPADQQPNLKAAFDTPADKRTPEQKQMVASNPKLNVTPGVLYQFDPPARKELDDMMAKINQKRAERPVEQFVSAVFEHPGEIPPTKIFHRGDYRDPRSEVLPGDLTIAAPDGKRLELPKDDAVLPTTGRRLAYAKYLTSGNHPLFGRVFVNRIWLHHFGRGIVDTPGEFGILGQRPSHPELLDWLATELAQNGWSLKKLHKTIMQSSVYRQSSARSPQKDAADGGNALLGRYPVRRLEAETLRDCLLVVTGRLDSTQFGPPLPVMEDTVGQVLTPDQQPRRTIYFQQRRSKPIAFLTTFDAPSGELNCDRRISSTAAPQALMLMNSDFMLQQASHFATRVRKETPATFALPANLVATLPRSASDAWQYGYGEWDAANKRLSKFTPLPHWSGSTWQGGPQLPDAAHGWAMLHASGGHSGDAQHSPIRRWVAPTAGVVTIRGKLHHPSPAGDGVRGRIVSSRSGLHSEWHVKTRSEATDASQITVQPGDTIDFVLDCVGDVTSDSFDWTVQLTLTDAKNASESWDSRTDFRGPQATGANLAQLAARAWQIVYQRPIRQAELDLVVDFLGKQVRTYRAAKHADPELAALTNLCQQLLASNEFLYVD
ncbi:PSD1 and planctomycete cytochrome C domain-containing protein [Tuwongella immobilis]|uniref:Cytochrome c domain-containing protein n=1 Tax=Tuwongella immobilis TaxID=692036 RepID=A0A6C2YQH4_9BACT|nr:PSD1 and planctomycete cytochrome C domain-containing protein [Tuwongella immobilis]VIP03890.1 Uncharacterized protein OS=Planctomyces maris DSM 8797 GN=PM8797T_03259 PE=4 SV=1: PSCyt1: PSCyt2: PSD1 [Tuwongella immobilis]VTS05147.1 Uncharacterized protein OS=Planctomyces maris DSM 8797 GN=PM8797T_03259 PE=4 SV=1: PSCyt1: PSCyt2: PSD1 [Tuwongella immobilis]